VCQQCQCVDVPCVHRSCVVVSASSCQRVIMSARHHVSASSCQCVGGVLLLQISVCVLSLQCGDGSVQVCDGISGDGQAEVEDLIADKARLEREAAASERDAASREVELSARLSVLTDSEAAQVIYFVSLRWFPRPRVAMTLMPIITGGCCCYRYRCN
jgi:hypothetical protein